VGRTRGHDWKLFRKHKLDWMPENLASEIEFVMNGTGCRRGLFVNEESVE